MASQRVSPTRYSLYAPLRYEVTRPFAVRTGTHFVLRTKGNLQQRHQYLVNELMPSIQRVMASLGRQPGPGPGQAEMANIQVFGEFLRGGRVIYDFHKRLTTALLATDVDSIPVSAIPRPNESLYIHFGATDGPGDETQDLEGAFVSWSTAPGEPERMMVDFTTRDQFGEVIFWLNETGEPMTGVTIDVSDSSKGIVAALEESVDEIMTQNELFVEQKRAMEAEMIEKYGEIISIPSPITSLRADLPLLRKGIALVVNCLLFLSAAPEDVVERWDDRAPADLVLQAEHGEKPGTRKTAERTLSNRDYLKVRLVGHQFAESVASSWHEETGRTVVTHFRRGHFRNQPHGPERSLRKIVFIPPVVVNPGQGEAPGRIYEA